jgi:hypothetical protein
MALTHLDVSLLTLNDGVANQYLGKFRGLSQDFAATMADGRAVASRYGKSVSVKRGFTFSIEELITLSSVRQSNLNITLFTLGGVAMLGRLRGGSLNVTTETDEASGAADLWMYPVATGTTFELTGDLRVDSNPVLTQVLGSGVAADQEFSAQIAVGGNAATLPVVLRSSSHKSDVGKVQIESVTMEGAGDPTGVSSTTSPIFVDILAGTALIAYTAKTTTGGTTQATVAGNALITSTRLTFNDAGLLTASHTFTNVGTPTITVAS